MKRILLLPALLGAWFFPQFALAASEGASASQLNLHATGSTPGLIALGIFIVAYVFVISEEFIHLRKSKPVVLAAGLIWIAVAWALHANAPDANAEVVVRHNILEFGELFLFLLVAMTYVNALEERLVFEKLRAYLVQKGLGFRQLFWVTGILSFFISPIADNLTTALLMCAVIMAVGGDNLKFVAIGTINIVVAANAGGAFSPFGDITTLMVWQKGILSFTQFFHIFFPALISYIIPASVMHFAVPNLKPAAVEEKVAIKRGGITIILLFLLTIVTAISFHNFIHLPPTVGMMTGLSYLMFYAYYLKKYEMRQNKLTREEADVIHPFDIFNKIKRAEWDTLFFFYGVILSVGGLATLGYLSLTSDFLYNQLGSGLSQAQSATPANSLVGILSALVDNIPVMFAVLTMNPTMSQGQWLLVTLTAGVGGSLLSVGSAAGVALMGQAKGKYTFFAHLKWTWIIFIGYVAGIIAHLWINNSLFYVPIN